MCFIGASPCAVVLIYCGALARCRRLLGAELDPTSERLLAKLCRPHFVLDVRWAGRFTRPSPLVGRFVPQCTHTYTLATFSRVHRGHSQGNPGTTVPGGWCRMTTRAPETVSGPFLNISVVLASAVRAGTPWCNADCHARLKGRGEMRMMLATAATLMVVTSTSATPTSTNSSASSPGHRADASSDIDLSRMPAVDISKVIPRRPVPISTCVSK